MSENDDQTQPVRPTGDQPSAPAAPPAPAAPAAAVPAAPPPAAQPPEARTGFRGRLSRLRGSGGGRTLGIRGLVAATLAALLVGGLGGAAIHAALDDRDGRGELVGVVGDPYGGRGGGPPGWSEDDLPEGLPPGQFHLEEVPPGELPEGFSEEFPGELPPGLCPGELPRGQQLPRGQAPSGLPPGTARKAPKQSESSAT